MDAKVNVKSGDVQVIAADERVGEQAIRETILKSNFKVVSIQGPIRIKP